MRRCLAKISDMNVQATGIATANVAAHAGFVRGSQLLRLDAATAIQTRCPHANPSLTIRRSDASGEAVMPRWSIKFRSRPDQPSGATFVETGNHDAGSSSRVIDPRRVSGVLCPCKLPRSNAAEHRLEIGMQIGATSARKTDPPGKRFDHGELRGI